MSDSPVPPPLPPPGTREYDHQQPDSSSGGRNVLIIFLVILAGAGAVGFKYLLQKRIKEMTQARQAQAELKKTQEELRKQARENPNASAEERLEQAQKAMAKASQNLSGEDRHLLEVSTEFVKEMAAISGRYDKSIHSLKEYAVLSSASNDTSEKIVRNRAAVNEFLTANTELTDYIKKWENHYEAYLRKNGIPEKHLQAALGSFTHGVELKRPFLLAIRQTDDRIGNAYLGILDVFEANLGKWKINPENGHLIFPDDESVKKYQELMNEVKNASEEQMSAQKKYLRL